MKTMTCVFATFRVFPHRWLWSKTTSITIMACTAGARAVAPANILPADILPASLQFVYAGTT